MSDLASQSGARRSADRLGEQAYSQTRAWLLTGAVAPGTFLREADLVRKLGMSRTPVREALTRLALERIIEQVPHGGFVVLGLSDEELIDVYQARGLLEGFAAGLAATNHSHGQLGELMDLLGDAEVALERGDDQRVNEVNRHLHATIARSSGNGYLANLLEEVREIHERYRPQALNAVGRRRLAHQEHSELVEAIRASDAERARDLATRHILAGLSVLIGHPADGEADGSGSVD